MYNERNILTMSDEEVKEGVIHFANKYNIKLNHVFLCREDDGYLDIFIEPTDEDIAVKYEVVLCDYMSGMIDINEVDIGSDIVDCASVAVFNISDRKKYQRVLDRCSKSGGELAI